jgi:O-antigen ligase
MPADGIPVPVSPTAPRAADPIVTGSGRRPAVRQRLAALPGDVREMAINRGWPWEGVQWSLTLVAFLLYIFVVTTFQISGGDVAMVAALLGVAFVPGGMRISATLGWMAAYVVWCAVGGLQSQYGSVVEPAVNTLGKIWLVALVAYNVLRSKENNRLFSVFFLACYALYPMRGAMVNYLGGYTVFGRAIWNYTYANPNDLAAITLLALSIAISLVPVERHKWTRYCVLLGCALLPILILMTQSRGAFLGLFVLVAFYIGGQQRKGRMLLAVGAIGVVVVLAAPGAVWNRVAGLAHMRSGTAELKQVDVEGSAYQRYQIWQVARGIITDHPAFGVGLGAYPLVHRDYVAGGGYNRIARGKRDTHSTYLNVAAETGFIGLTFFLATVATALLIGERSRRRWRAILPDGAQQLYALELGMVAYLVAGLFGSFGKISFLYLHAVLITAVAQWLNRTGEAAITQGSSPARVRGVARTPPPGVAVAHTP